MGRKKEEPMLMVEVRKILNLILSSRDTDGSYMASSDLVEVQKDFEKLLKDTLSGIQLRRFILNYYEVKDEVELIEEHGLNSLLIFEKIFGDDLWIGRIQYGG